jgi:hypothetical protein
MLPERFAQGGTCSTRSRWVQLPYPAVPFYYGGLMEGKIIHDWKIFEKEFEQLNEPSFYINLDTSNNGNVLRIYAEDEETVLIFEPNDMDLRKWKNELDSRGIIYKWGKSPVQIL